jgi:hypothetical protein
MPSRAPAVRQRASRLGRATQDVPVDVPRLGTSRRGAARCGSLAPSRLDKPAACPHTHRPDDDDEISINPRQTFA